MRADASRGQTTRKGYRNYRSLYAPKDIVRIGYGMDKKRTPRTMLEWQIVIAMRIADEKSENSMRKRRITHIYDHIIHTAIQIQTNPRLHSDKNKIAT